MTAIAKMKRKTYRNFLIVWNALQKEKGYDKETAREISHRIFDNAESDQCRPILWYYNAVLPREEFEQLYGRSTN